MAIPKGKERITITIHTEAKQLIDNLLSLHSEKLSYSKLVEISLLFYTKACMKEIGKLEKQEKEKKN